MVESHQYVTLLKLSFKEEIIRLANFVDKSAPYNSKRGILKVLMVQRVILKSIILQLRYHAHLGI